MLVILLDVSEKKYCIYWETKHFTFIYGISTSQIYVNLWVFAFRAMDFVFFLRIIQDMKLSNDSVLNMWTTGPFPPVFNMLLNLLKKQICSLFHSSLYTITFPILTIDFVLKTFYEEIGNWSRNSSCTVISLWYIY